VYGICFILGRLAFADLINRVGGFPVARVSFVVECLGLVLLAIARVPLMALVGAALTGLGFSLVFPALAVEAVRTIPTESRGTALGAYTVFVDLSLFVSGPAIGAVIAGLGYRAGFLCAAAASALALGLTLWLGSRAKTSLHHPRRADP
jgi:predicted MFS family arabinose efflux permease